MFMVAHNPRSWESASDLCEFEFNLIVQQAPSHTRLLYSDTLSPKEEKGNRERERMKKKRVKKVN